MSMAIDQNRDSAAHKPLLRRLQQLGLLGFLFFLIKGVAWVALGLWLAWEIK